MKAFGLASLALQSSISACNAKGAQGQPQYLAGLNRMVGDRVKRVEFTAVTAGERKK